MLYDDLLRITEDKLITEDKTFKDVSALLEIIIKIKTIKFMNLQTEILEASARRTVLQSPSMN